MRAGWGRGHFHNDDSDKKKNPFDCGQKKKQNTNAMERFFVQTHLVASNLVEQVEPRKRFLLFLTEKFSGEKRHLDAHLTHTNQGVLQVSKENSANWACHTVIFTSLCLFVFSMICCFCLFVFGFFFFFFFFFFYLFFFFFFNFF